jgi:arylsulfatase A-like enzyme
MQLNSNPAPLFSGIILSTITMSLSFVPSNYIYGNDNENAGKPNVIVIITDDQGYGDLSIHGNPILQTPNLDKLHQQSIRLTDFHVAPMCTPTRAQLLTGLDAVRTGAVNVSSGRSLLRRELKTMADYYSDNGYNTGIFGKWHIGDNYPFRPADRGFHYSLWFPSSHIGSVPDYWAIITSMMYTFTTEREKDSVDIAPMCSLINQWNGLAIESAVRSRFLLLFPQIRPTSPIMPTKMILQKWN